MTSALLPVYARADLAFERGEGAWLISGNRRYLDFASGVAVTALGHAHPHLVQALKDQAEKLWHCSNLFRVPGQEKLADRLAAASFADKVFFCNSGLEAVEGCLKFQRKYHDETGNPGRWRTIVCEGAFHGRSLATIAAGGQPKHLAGFDPPTHGFDRVAFGDLDAVKNAITDKTGAILVEPIQGEGGIRVPDAGYLKGLRALADEHGILLMLDEVQTGFGRTGKFFAHEWAGIAPDLMAIAKGLGGGFPVGAILMTDKVAKTLGPGCHGSTFGGNPLAMAVGNAVLDVVQGPGFLAKVQKVAAYLRGKLEALPREYPGIFEAARGQGLLLGLKLKVPNTEFIAKTAEAGLLSVAAGENVMRLLPPLILEESEADEAARILGAVAKAWK